MKWFLILLMGIFLLNFTLAGTCTPDSGYSTCYEQEWTVDCNAGDQMTSEVTVQTTGYPKYDATNKYYYIDYKFEGDEFYAFEGSYSSWDSLLNCDSSGCHGATKSLPSQGRYIIAEGVGDSYNDNFAFVAWDKDTNSNGCYSWTRSGYGWVGSAKINVNIACEGTDKNWVCTDWSACSNNQQTRTCTTVCGLEMNKPDESRNCNECETGQTKCEGLDYFTCSAQPTCQPGSYCIQGGLTDNPNVWQNMGKVKDKCGVECTLDNQCEMPSITAPYCKQDSIYQGYTESKCINYNCEYTPKEDFKELCDFGCANGLCLEEDKISVYNLIDNTCVEKIIKKSEKTIIDLNLGDCQNLIITDQVCTENVYGECSNGKEFILKECINGNLVDGATDQCGSYYNQTILQKFISWIKQLFSKFF